MILDMIQGCRYLQGRRIDGSSRRTRRHDYKDSKVGTGPVCCAIVRSLLQTLRVYIYTLVLTRLLVDHDYNICYLKLTPRCHVRLVSIINSSPSLYPIHVITHSKCLPLSPVEQFFCRMTMYSRP
jgi:hypothetical protein